MNDLLGSMVRSVDANTFLRILLMIADVARERGYAIEFVPGNQEPTEQEKALFLKNPIQAIKDLRNRTGCALKDARDKLIETRETGR